MYICIHFHEKKKNIQISYFLCILIPCKQTVPSKSTISYLFPLHANNFTMSSCIFKFHANKHAHLNQLHLMCSNSNAILLNQHLYIALLFSLEKYFTLATSQLPLKYLRYDLIVLHCWFQTWINEELILLDTQYRKKMWNTFFFYKKNMICLLFMLGLALAYKGRVRA